MVRTEIATGLNVIVAIWVHRIPYAFAHVANHRLRPLFGCSAYKFRTKSSTGGYLGLGSHAARNRPNASARPVFPRAGRSHPLCGPPIPGSRWRNAEEDQEVCGTEKCLCSSCPRPPSASTSIRFGPHETADGVSLIPVPIIIQSVQLFPSHDRCSSALSSPLRKRSSRSGPHEDTATSEWSPPPKSRGLCHVEPS